MLTTLTRVKGSTLLMNEQLRSSYFKFNWIITWILIGFPSFCQMHWEFRCLSKILQVIVESSPGLTCRSSGSLSKDCRPLVKLINVKIIIIFIQTFLLSIEHIFHNLEIITVPYFTWSQTTNETFNFTFQICLYIKQLQVLVEICNPCLTLLINKYI